MGKLIVMFNAVTVEVLQNRELLLGLSALSFLTCSWRQTNLKRHACIKLLASSLLGTELNPTLTQDVAYATAIDSAGTETESS